MGFNELWIPMDPAVPERKYDWGMMTWLGGLTSDSGHGSDGLELYRNTSSGWWLSPSEKWWSSSVGMMTSPIYGKHIKSMVQNHQPEFLGLFVVLVAGSVWPSSLLDLLVVAFKCFLSDAPWKLTWNLELLEFCFEHVEDASPFSMATFFADEMRVFGGSWVYFNHWAKICQDMNM